MNPPFHANGPQPGEQPPHRRSDVPPVPPVSNWWDEDEPGRVGIKRFRTPLLVGLLMAGGLVAGWKLLGQNDAGLVRHVPAPIVTVSIRNLPPTPPLPKPPEPPPIKNDPIKAEKEDPKPESPAPKLETATKGPNGSPDLGIGREFVSGKPARPSAPGAPVIWTRYASQATSRISDAMRSNPKTRKAKFELLDVRLWPDLATGRVTRAALVGTTGDAAVDQAIRDEVLVGMVMPQPPPQDMPLPINLRVRASRPN